MALKQILAPEIEPITVDEAKTHLRVIGSDDDAYIAGLISMARNVAETLTQRALINQTFRFTTDSFPCSRVIKLERAPLVSVSSVKYLDTTGTEVTLSSTQYTVDTESEPGRIVLKDGYSWPSTAFEPNVLKVEFIAGYGESAESVPSDIIQAIYLLVGTFYTNREHVIIAPYLDAISLPGAFEMLLFPYLVRST